MPRRRHTKAFEKDPSREYLFYLAEKLGVWDVDQLERDMPHRLFVEWFIYHARKAQRRELAIEEAKGSKP